MAIVTLDELREWIGIDDPLTGRTKRAFESVHTRADGIVKRYLGYAVEKATYTDEYHQGVARSAEPSEISVSGGVVTRTSRSTVRSAIQLLNIPVVSITSLKEDSGGFYGKVSGSFASTSLTEGTDFVLDLTNVESNGYSMTGLVWRRGGRWPSSEGSVQVTYSAGWTAEEMPEEIKQAVCEVGAWLWDRRQRTAAGAVPVQPSFENVVGVGSVSLRDERGAFGIPQHVADYLQPWRYQRLYE